MFWSLLFALFGHNIFHVVVSAYCSVDITTNSILSLFRFGMDWTDRYDVVIFLIVVVVHFSLGVMARFHCFALVVVCGQALILYCDNYYPRFCF